MVIQEFEEVNDSIAILEELGLPVSVEKLQEREDIEKKYLHEILVPQIQSQIQTLVNNFHTPFCLVVDHQYGTPVLVKVAEKAKVKTDEKRVVIKTTKGGKSEKPRRVKIKNLYDSSSRQKELKKYIESLPKGNTLVQFTFNQSYSSLSKLLRTLQAKDMYKYLNPVFEILILPTTGRVSPAEFISMLEPEQFVKETTKDGDVDRIVLWTQSQKVDTRDDGMRVKVFEEDGVTPVLVDKKKKIKTGQWTLKVLCDLIVQKEYFANQRAKTTKKLI